MAQQRLFLGTHLMNANIRNGIVVYRLLMLGVVLHVIFVSLARQYLLLENCICKYVYDTKMARSV